MWQTILANVPDDDLPEVAYHVIRCLRHGLSSEQAAEVTQTGASNTHDFFTPPVQSIAILRAIEALSGHPVDAFEPGRREHLADEVFQILWRRSQPAGLEDSLEDNPLDELRAEYSPPQPLLLLSEQGEISARNVEQSEGPEIRIITKRFNEQFQVLLGNAEVAVNHLQLHLRLVQKAVSDLGVELRQVTRPEQPRIAAQDVAVAHREGSGANILVLEDDPDVQMVIRDLLTPLGYHVTLTSSRDEALRTAGNLATPIQLLIADVQIPETSGPEVARVIQQIRPRLKVLFISGGHELDVQQAVGSAPYLLKPFTDLPGKVRDVLTGNRSSGAS